MAVSNFSNVKHLGECSVQATSTGGVGKTGNFQPTSCYVL